MSCVHSRVVLSVAPFSSVAIVETWIIHYSQRLRRKTLKTQFGVQCLSFCIKHFAEPFLHGDHLPKRCELGKTFEEYTRTTRDEQPGLIVLRTCCSSKLFLVHRENEVSTVHAVCLFLRFMKKFSSTFLRSILFNCASIYGGPNIL